MQRTLALSAALLLGMLAHAAPTLAKGTHIKQAVLVSRAGATVGTATPDATGRCVFRNVPEGEYKVVLTSGDGRSVTIGDLDGDGVPDLIVQGGMAASSGGAGKVNVQDLSMTRQTQGATFGEKVNAGVHAAGSAVQQGAAASPRDPASGQATGKRTAVGGAVPGGAVISAAVGGAVSPRDAASGLPTGKRQHKPLACVVGWDGTVKGFASEAAARGATSAPAPTAGGVGVKVHCPSPGTVEVLSWSWGMTQSGR